MCYPRWRSIKRPTLACFTVLPPIKNHWVAYISGFHWFGGRSMKFDVRSMAVRCEVDVRSMRSMSGRWKFIDPRAQWWELNDSDTRFNSGFFADFFSLWQCSLKHSLHTATSRTEQVSSTVIHLSFVSWFHCVSPGSLSPSNTHWIAYNNWFRCVIVGQL